MTINERIRQLKETALQKGGELHLDKKVLNDKNHLNCVWYDSGSLATFSYRGYTCSIEVQGDVSFSVLDKDFEETILEYKKVGTGSAYDDPEVRKVIPNDRKLSSLEESGRLYWSLNNWVELRVFDQKDREHEVDMILDNNVLDAIDNLDTFTEIVDKFIKTREPKKPSLTDKILDASTRAPKPSIQSGAKSKDHQNNR